MQIIDLSQPLRSGMPVFPGDPEVAIAQALSVQKDGVAVSHLDMGSHAGTHMDAPSHSIVGGRTIDQVPLELLVGEAVVLDCGVAAGSMIGVRDVAGGLPAELPRIVLVCTGWDAHYGDAEMLSHPYVGLELARELWERGVRVLGTDALSPDCSSDLSAGLPVHEFWLGQDGVIVENLRGLMALPPAPFRFRVSLLPLHLVGVDGSPIRAIAEVS